METKQIIIFNNIKDFKKICIKNNVNLFNFKYILQDTVKLSIDKSKKFPLIYFTVWEKNNLIGILKQSTTQEYFYNNNCIFSTRYINYITINEDYQNQGYGSFLIKEFFHFLKTENINEEIILSPYTQEGFKYIKKKFTQYSKEFDIKIKQSYCFEL